MLGTFPLLAVLMLVVGTLLLVVQLWLRPILLIEATHFLVGIGGHAHARDHAPLMALFLAMGILELIFTELGTSHTLIHHVLASSLLLLIVLFIFGEGRLGFGAHKQLLLALFVRSWPHWCDVLRRIL